VANELRSEPDHVAGTRLFLKEAAAAARKLDPTVPIALDINGRPGHPRQRTYRYFDMLGVNQYFGWYPWVADFNQLEPYLRLLHAQYPRHALVMTEFGAEALPKLVDAPVERKGSYAFQAMHVARTLDVVDHLPFLSGAIYWTLREFEIYPGWTGGVGQRNPDGGPNTRHHKGLITYDGEKKPAWQVIHDRYVATPLYRR
jgi:beta-glucuronidase